jgi:hypothetical protein
VCVYLEVFPWSYTFSCSKYRVLDDCSRLRDIIKALPEKRHFVPSLLLFVWAADEPASSDSTTLPADFLDMVGRPARVGAVFLMIS